jgi:hypothetical protein
VAANITTIESITAATAAAGYVDLPTVGPTLPVTVPGSGQVLVSVASGMIGVPGGTSCYMSYAVSGVPANTRAASDATAVILGAGNGQLLRASAASELTGLTPETITLTAKYKTSAANVTCTYSNRTIIAIPLP